MKYSRVMRSLTLSLTLSALIGCDGDETTPTAGVEAGNPAGVMAGTPMAGTPMGGTPMAGTPMAGTPMAGTPMAGTPMGGTPMGGTPMGGTPMGGTPMGGAPMGGEPVGGEPVGGEPVGGAPMGGEPAAEGACTNEADEARFMSLGEDGIDMAIQGCIFGSCLGAATDPAMCSQCIQSSTDFSTECTSCFVEVVACTLTSCINACANLANPAGCDECRDQNCTPLFDTCAGDLMQ